MTSTTETLASSVAPAVPPSRLLQMRVSCGAWVRPWLLRKWMRVALDGACGSAAILFAYGLRFDMHPPNWAQHQMWIWAVTLFVLDPLAVSTFGGYRSTWQHVNVHDLWLLSKRLTCLNVLIFMAAYFSPGLHIMPYGVVVIDLMLIMILSSGLRVLRRTDHEALARISAGERILVVGTGDTIAGALRQLVPLYGGAVCGIVTEGDSFANRSIQGVSVLGSTANLTSLIHSHRATMLVLCCADMENLPEILQTAADLNVPVKLIPSVQDLLDNRVRVSRPVTVAALRQGKSDADISMGAEVLECLRDKVVLVTGAGGSIGSEIVRQVASAPVRKLVLLDQDENALFELLAEFDDKSKLQPIVADIRDAGALHRVFRSERPQVVLHAAAYKHVPMMEANPCEAVLNNVLGTRRIAEAARAFQVERMVMISSDKAVRPSSVMGATKRLAEVVIQQIARSDEGSRTQFACVRFGNVLGSRGSVLPMFLKQIEQGGPLTVTHADMTRYFMTIPQAVHLVLQASTLGSKGHVYMLEMGDPVRILSFAREVIQLAGLTPDKDIEIRIVGSRPGEKLHEQLWNEDAQVTPTTFEHIYEVFAEDPDGSFPRLLQELERAATEHRPELIRGLLRELPIDYLTERANVQSVPVHSAGVSVIAA